MSSGNRTYSTMVLCTVGDIPCPDISEGFKMEDKKPTRQFLKQLHISATIMAISLCAGLIEARGLNQMPKMADAKEALNVSKELVEWRKTCQDTVPFVGVILLTVIAEFVGRKAAFGVIILLTMTASSLSIPGTKLCLKLVYIASAMSSGGQIILLYICIAEYCEPKHRLVFSIANATVNRIGCIIENFAFEYLAKVDIVHYGQYFEFFVAMVCLGSLLQWPESPYWLALKGRQDESLNSFLLLRCDSSVAEMELKGSLESRDRPDSCKLFFLPLFITTVLSSMFWCSVLFQKEHIAYWLLSNKDYYYYQFVMECVIIFILCKGIMFFYEFGTIVIVLPLTFFATLQYAFLMFFFYVIFSGGKMSGGLQLSLMLSQLMNRSVFWTCYKLVIIGPATFSMSKFAECIPLKRRSLLMCIFGVCFFLIKITYDFIAIIIKEKFGIVVLFLVLTKMMLFGLVFLAGFLVPRTEGKTLTEIEKTLYLPKREQY